MDQAKTVLLQDINDLPIFDLKTGMKKLNFLFVVVLSLVLLQAFTGNNRDKTKHRNKKHPEQCSGTCTGSSSCKACTNCSHCAHCSRGGTCGVCQASKTSAVPSTDTSTNQSNACPKIAIPTLIHFVMVSQLQVYVLPDSSSAIAGTLHEHDCVMVLEKRNNGWTKVVTVDGVEIAGYVRREGLR